MGQDTTVADRVFAVLMLLFVAAGVVGWIVDHWQWLLILPIGGAFALGLVKFGWDAATTVDKKARD